MAATARHEAELKKKALEEVKKARDPIDKIRWQCLSRGAAGIRDLGRVFRNFDDSGDQQLDYKEFCKGTSEHILRATVPYIRGKYKTGTSRDLLTEIPFFHCIFFYKKGNSFQREPKNTRKFVKKPIQRIKYRVLLLIRYYIKHALLEQTILFELIVK